MVKDFVKQFFLKINIFVFVAFTVAFFIYSGFFPELKDFSYKFNSLCPVSKITELKGRVISSPVKMQKSGKYSVKFKVEASKNKNDEIFSANGNVILFLPAEMVESMFPGKLYSKSIKTGAIFCEDGVNLTVFGKFSSKSENNYNLVFFVDKAVQHSYENSFFGKINLLRNLLRLQLKRLLFAWGAGGGLLLALITGMREYTDSTITDAFKNSGLSHILALSGMHLSLFRNLSSFFSTKILGKRRIGIFFELFAILSFVFFAGLSPSLFRALLCSVLSILLSLLGFKNTKLLNILSISFLIHILVFPNDYKNAGFILSYGALAGILIFSEIVNFFLVKFIPPKISSPLSASFSAQTVTSPISYKLFGTFSPIGIISSVVVSPVVTVFIYSGLFFIVLCLIFPFFAKTGDFFINLLYNFISVLVLFFSKFKIN